MYKVFPPIPAVSEDLYRHFVMPPDPERWPDYLRNDPMKGYSLYAFHQGLRLGLQLAAAGLEVI